MDITIRLASIADLDQVGRIFAEENRYHVELLPERFRVVEPIITHEWFASVLSTSTQALFVAEVDGQAVGVLLLREMQSPEDPIFRLRRYVTIEEIALSQPYRGRGIGRRLVKQAEQWALERGIGQIEVDVWERNQPAIAFYERLGFEPVRRRMQRLIPRREGAQSSGA